MGMQSAVTKERLTLGRLSDSSQVRDAVDMAKKEGIDNISLDIMLGVPYQTMETLDESIDFLLSLGIPHISAYMLKIEEGTPFDKIADSLILPDEDTERDMYFAVADELRDAGLRQYEISNFAKPGKQCRHNVRYWNCDEYIGFGPDAHSYFGGKRFSFKKDLKLYIDSFNPEIRVDEQLLDEYIDIPPSARIAEYVMLRFRMSEGIDTSRFKKRFGREFDEIYAERIRPFLQSGHIFRTSKGYAFTPEGMYVSNYILSRIVDFDLIVPGSDS
jgi:oxygen-independent coproporphyrinogen-3 oxidase